MNRKLRQAVRAEQISLLYKNVGVALLASVIIASALTLALWQESPNSLQMVWQLAILVLSGVGYYLVTVYNRTRQRFSENTWLGLFLVGIFLAGVLWGSLGLFFSPQTNLTHWFLVLFVLVGLAGGAMTTLSAHYLAYIVFVIPLLLPTVFHLLVSNVHDSGLMSSLIMLFIVLTTLLVRRSNHDIDKTILLRIEREAMSYSIEGQIKMVAEQHERIIETQASLRQANELFAAAFDTIQVMYAYLDTDFNFMRVNKAFADKNGKRTEDFVGKNYFELFPGEETKKIFEQVRDSGVSYRAEEEDLEFPSHGTTYWDWSLQPLRGNDGEVMSLLLDMNDVTVRKQAQTAVQEKEAYLQSIMDATVEVILTMDRSGSIEMVNPAVESMFGYKAESLIGKNISVLMPENIEKHHHLWMEAYLKQDGKILAGRRIDTEGKRKDGSIFPLEISVSDKVVNGRHIFTSIMRDITEQKNAMAALKVKNTELQYLSAHDGLTGLHNRRTADEFLQREWNRAVRANSAITIMMIDVDYFKKFNDQYGHQAGDTCLQRIASCMKLVLNRPSDLIARFGGEEFIAILPETEHEGALQVAEHIRQAVIDLEIPHIASNNDYVTVSIGIATARPVQLLNFEKLVSCADKALYEAKAQEIIGRLE